MIAVYAFLTVLGMVLLAVTAIRVLVGGLQGSPARPRRRATGAEPSARSILDERYAAGQLSTEEYERRLRVMEGDRP